MCSELWGIWVNRLRPSSRHESNIDGILIKLQAAGFLSLSLTNSVTRQRTKNPKTNGNHWPIANIFKGEWRRCVVFCVRRDQINVPQKKGRKRKELEENGTWEICKIHTWSEYRMCCWPTNWFLQHRHRFRFRFCCSDCSLPHSLSGSLVCALPLSDCRKAISFWLQLLLVRALESKFSPGWKRGNFHTVVIPQSIQIAVWKEHTHTDARM